MSDLHTKFGDLLKLERERQGISLADVSDNLKIAEDALHNIEAGDAAALPSDLYFKMFSKSYAEHLGIDYSRTVEAMCEELGVPLEQNSRNDTPARPKPASSRPPKKVEKEDKEPTQGSQGNVRKLIFLASGIVGGFIIFLIVFRIFFANATGEGDDDSSSSTTTESGIDAKAGQVSANEAYDWSVPTYQTPDSITLTLVARQASWATIRADGDTTLYQTLTPGRQYTQKAKYRFLVSIGVPRVVDITIDDQPAFLASATTGRISRVEIDQTNRETFRSPAQPAPTATIPASTTEAITDDVDSTPQEGSDSI